MTTNKNTLINTDYLLLKLKEGAKKLGRVTLKPALTLYYVMRSAETPKSDKMIIVTALLYLILPFDILSVRRLPIIGWIDELAALVITYNKMTKHVTPEIEHKVEDILNKWFPEYEPYQVVE